MKAIILNLFIAVGLFLSGCSDQSSLTGPSQQNLQSSDPFVSLGDANLSLHKDDPLYVEQTINGNTGGTMSIVGSFDEDKIHVNGTLTVPAGAYTGDQTITVYMKGEKAVIDFGPSPFTFNIPLQFTMEITGVKIKDKDEDKIRFIYLDGYGNVTPVEMQGTTVANKKNKTLSVYGAQLPHFSRYGWAK